MSKIQVMSELLANKIAAGEVVEKISSVVKELVENSIDAKSSSIKINLIKSGFESIRVVDDGIGMNSDDALLCFSRHATSKILKDDDLFFINTLGFRGEAIPSIASVSKVTLITCSESVGSKIVIEGGKLISNEVGDSRIGSSFTIENLFYNTPARLKYLKSENSELASVVALIERLALSMPKIKFLLTNDDKELVKTSGSGDLLKTIHEIYGLSISKNMIKISASNDDADIFGYICKPEILKSNRNHIITLVNNRIVKNNDLFKAINDGYYTYKPETKYPIVILNIELDPTIIDVNIHPTKQDIKIGKMEELSTLIFETIKNALYENLLIPKMSVSEVEDTEIKSYPELKEIDTLFAETKEIKEQTTFDFKEEVVTPNAKLKSLKLYPVGLALGTYIIAQNDDGMYLIDQHAAQERVNYEKYFNALKARKKETTSLLIPITIELSPSEYLTIKDNMEILDNMGIMLEEFGINTFTVKEHPTWLKEGYEEESIKKIIDLIISMGKDFNEIKFNEHVAITLACKLSIKANYNITIEEMENLLNQLVETDNPYNCPHGRPTIITFSIYELEKMFKRAMN